MNALDFSSCPNVLTTGVWIHTAATNSTTLHLALDPEIKPPTFLCFSTFAPPTYLAPTASCAVSKRNKEGLNADITNTSVCEDEVLDCDVAHQSHVSGLFFPSLPINCESLGASCFASHRRSDVLLQVSVSVSVSVSVCLSICSRGRPRICFLSERPVGNPSAPASRCERSSTCLQNRLHEQS